MNNYNLLTARYDEDGEIIVQDGGFIALHENMDSRYDQDALERAAAVLDEYGDADVVVLQDEDAPGPESAALAVVYWGAALSESRAAEIAHQAATRA